MADDERAFGSCVDCLQMLRLMVCECKDTEVKFSQLWSLSLQMHHIV